MKKISVFAYLGQQVTKCKIRNKILFYFGLFNFVVAVGLFILSFFINIQYLGTHAFYKPVKFGLSIGIYAWSMGWFCFYLDKNFHIKIFSWGITALLGFEIVYIVIQALFGQGSHYNIATPFYAFLYMAMAIAATLATLCTAYVGALFITGKFPNLPSQYLWGIRLGIFVFVIFAFEGFVMGSRMAHTVGVLDGSEGYWFLNWSKTFGDLRVSHFLGIHALQIIPFSAYYIFKSKFSVIVFGLVYFLITAFILVLTLMGKAVL